MYEAEEKDGRRISRDYTFSEGLMTLAFPAGTRLSVYFRLR